MPVSSKIIGVDLDAIKPIPGVTTFVADITTAKCRQDIKNTIGKEKVDMYLRSIF